MNYCSINEAWGTNNYISNQFKRYQNADATEIENFDSGATETKEHFTGNKNIAPSCGDFLNHLMGCQRCQRKLKNKMKNKVVEKFSSLVDENRDVIVMVLVGISLVLFFNLVNNMTRN